MSDRNALHFQMSLMQLMKLVVFCAAALSCVAPMLRVWMLGALHGTGMFAPGMFVLLFSAIAVPLVWVVLSFALVRPSLWRERLILSLLLCSVSVVLASAAWILYTTASEMIGNSPFVDRQDMWRGFLLVGVVTLALGAAFLFLASRLARKFGSEARAADAQGELTKCAAQRLA